MQPSVLRLAARLSATATRRLAHHLSVSDHLQSNSQLVLKHVSTRSGSSSRHRFATTAAVGATAVTVAASVAHSEAPSDEAKVPTAGKVVSHDWKAVVAALREAQRTEGAGFRAVRRSLPRGTDNEWAHDVEFSLSRGADVHSVVAALASGLGGKEGAWLRVEESGTRKETVMKREGRFEASVSIPRVAPLDGRVAVHILKPAEGSFSDEELRALVSAYRISQARPDRDQVRLLDGKHSVDIGPPTHIDRDAHSRGHREKFFFDHDDNTTSNERSKNDNDNSRAVRKRARSKLKELGVDVVEKEDGLSWDALAGYTDVKERIEDTLSLPLRHPEVYERIVRGTRKRAECNVPKAVLYEGPPGCGKTLSARILASTIGVPFVHVRVETLLSKYYGETTRKMAEILEAANSLGRCIVFLDECDSVGLRRSSNHGEVHEVTRRTLSVLLRFIDGMDGARDAIILAATNHKEDLDAALVSRFDVIVSFPLPDLDTRIAVLRLYAKQLSDEDLRRVGQLTWGFSGRELVDICEEAERMRAGVIVRSRIKLPLSAESRKSLSEGLDDELPKVEDYVEAIDRKAEHVVGRWNDRFAQPDALHRLMQDATINEAIAVNSVNQSDDATASTS